MTLKEAIVNNNVSANDVIVIREPTNEGIKESRCLNCYPYRMVLKTKYNKDVEDFWRDGAHTYICLLKGETKNEK